LKVDFICASSFINYFFHLYFILNNIFQYLFPNFQIKMQPFLIKRPRIEQELLYRKISSARSKFPRFNTTQYVTRFVIEKLGDDPERELGHIIEQMIDEAYEGTSREYGRYPSKYNVLIDGQSLNQPIIVSIDERIPGLEIEIVILLTVISCILNLKILNELDKLVQSDKFIDLLRNPLTMLVTVFRVVINFNQYLIVV